MVKTQVQIPDHLYQEAKRISREYEMSFAEVVRRGLERVVPVYPPKKAAGKWSLPKPRKLGLNPLTPEELKELAQMTSFEEQLIEEDRKARATRESRAPKSAGR